MNYCARGARTKPNVCTGRFLRTAENPQARRTIAAHHFLRWNSSLQYIEIPGATPKTVVREHQLEHPQLHRLL